MIPTFLSNAPGIVTDRGVIRANVGPEQHGPITRLPGAGGGHWTGSKDDAARANAAGGMKRPAATGRTGNATGAVIAPEMASAGPAAPSTPAPARAARGQLGLTL